MENRDVINGIEACKRRIKDAHSVIDAKEAELKEYYNVLISLYEQKYSQFMNKKIKLNGLYVGVLTGFEFVKNGNYTKERYEYIYPKVARLKLDGTQGKDLYPHWKTGRIEKCTFELVEEMEYDFKCNGKPEKKGGTDIWSFAVLWIKYKGMMYGVEYNLCYEKIDNTAYKDLSAIYKIEPCKCETDTPDMDLSSFIKYDIRYSNGWQRRLKTAMIAAAYKLHKLSAQ